MAANGLYTETCVKRKVTAGMQAGKAGIIILAVLLLIGGMMIAQTLVSLLGVVAFIVYFIVQPMFKIEWEYVFCDGQIDFDRISGGERRKHIYRLDLDNIEIMAPANSHRMDSYYHIQGVKMRDFTSKEANRNVYAIYMANGAEKTLVTFEPSETMLDYARQKAPRKMFMD